MNRKEESEDGIAKPVTSFLPLEKKCISSGIISLEPRTAAHKLGTLRREENRMKRPKRV